MREVKTYSEAFKRGIAGRGVYNSLSEAGRRNGIMGNETLTRWWTLPRLADTIKLLSPS